MVLFEVLIYEFSEGIKFSIRMQRMLERVEPPNHQ